MQSLVYGLKLSKNIFYLALVLCYTLVQFNEGGVAAPRVLELLLGFWSAPGVLESSHGFGSCSQDFGVTHMFWSTNVKIYPTFYEKSFKKSIL